VPVSGEDREAGTLGTPAQPEESGQRPGRSGRAAPLVPAQTRVQSEEELLSQEAPRERRALDRFGSVRVGRTVQFAATAATLGLIAAVSGTLVHGSDVHSTAAGASERVLMRLVGGGPELTLSRESGRSTGALSVGVQMQVTVRNDGARAEQVVSADIQQPGVVLDTPAATLTVRPGQSQAIGLHLTVACNRVDLPQYPDAVTLNLRDPDGRETRDVFAFHPGHPTPPVGAATGQLGFFDPVSPGSSYFAMCSEGIQETEAPSTFLGMVGSATAADPTISYRLQVETGNQWARILSDGPDSRVLMPLGLSAGTDLAGPVEIDPGAPQQVTVAEKVTDCGTASNAITALGLANYVAQAREGVGLSTKAADPRFQQVGPLPVDFFQDGSVSPDGTTSVFTMRFIEELAAACPSLK
jgi:hypothetical protein